MVTLLFTSVPRGTLALAAGELMDTAGSGRLSEPQAARARVRAAQVFNTISSGAVQADRRARTQSAPLPRAAAPARLTARWANARAGGRRVGQRTGRTRGSPRQSRRPVREHARQLRQRQPAARLHRAQRLAGALGDLGLGQPLEVRQLQDRALLRREPG